MIEDRWINFVLLNGWRLKAEVNEDTGELTLLVSNENGVVDSCNIDYRVSEERYEPDGTHTLDFSGDEGTERMVPDGEGGFKVERSQLAEEFKQSFKLKNEKSN
jgi:hypothetical protein